MSDTQNSQNNQATTSQAASAGQTTTIVVSNSSNGLISVLITLFFGPLGAFFCWWLLAKKNVFKSLLWALLYTVLLIISAGLCAVIVGFVLLPVVWIVLIVHVYKSCSAQSTVIGEIRRS